MSDSENYGLVLVIGLKIELDGARSAALIVGPRSGPSDAGTFVVSDSIVTAAFSAFEAARAVWDAPADERAA